MTVSSPVSRIVHLTHEAVTDYTFPFKVFKAGELAVDLVDASFRVIPLQLGADFTVTGLGLDQGGTITLTAAGRDKAGTGLSLVMLRRMDFTQETDYRPHDVFPAETHERALDVLTMICQELREMVGRAMIAPPNVDKPIQYSDLVALQEGAEAARDAAQAEAERAEAAAGQAAEEVRGELAGMVAAAETAQGKAEQAKTQARGAATMAKNMAALARRWAANPEDEEVRDGLFSARHYAARAAQSLESLALPDLNEARAGQVLMAVLGEAGLRLEYGPPPAPDLQPIWEALAGKLPTATYEADAPLRITAWGRIAGNGAIIEAKNVSHVIRVGTGGYYIYLTVPITKRGAMVGTCVPDSSGSYLMSSSVNTPAQNHPNGVFLYAHIVRPTTLGAEDREFSFVYVEGA